MSKIAATHIVRLTGVLIERGKLLVLEQSIANREWYLPGGRLESDETIEQGIVREMREETGLDTAFHRIISISDTEFKDPSTLNVLIEVKRVSGKICLPDNSLEINPINNVVFIPLEKIEEHGFSHNFYIACKNSFKDVKTYSGLDTFFDFL